MKALFFLRFMLAFAILIPLGAVLDFPGSYAKALAVVGASVSPAFNGWSLDGALASGTGPMRFRRGAESIPLKLSLDALALGLLPLLGLIAATPRMWARQRIQAALLGVAGLFALHLVVLTAYPWMVRNPNAVKDISGTFLGLLTFVGAPVILWFALTFRALREIWKL